MVRRAFRLAYDGTGYRGYQRQPHAETVENALFDALSAHADVLSTICPVRHGESHDTTSALVDWVRRGMREAGLNVRLGGGTTAWFTDLNRSDVPVEDLAFLAYGSTPQVHAIDDDVLRENLHGVLPLLRSARTLAQGRPVRVGPVTLQPRQTIPSDGSASEALWPSWRDPRLDTSFGAAWTLGVIGMHARGGAEALTLFELSGPEGIRGLSDDGPEVERARAAQPMTRRAPPTLGGVMATFARHAGRDVLASRSSSPLDCLAVPVRTEEGVECHLVNLAAVPVRARVRWPDRHADVSRDAIDHELVIAPHGVGVVRWTEHD
jgi:hypothetical protein